MNIFDIFYYLTYHFLTKVLKRGKLDAKLSSLSHLAVYLSFTSVTILCIIGLIEDNAISRWVASTVNKTFIFSVFVCIVVYIVFGHRYYRMMDIEDIEKKIGNLSKWQKNFYKTLVIIVMLAVPICSFIFYRLYVIGHIRWW